MDGAAQPAFQPQRNVRLLYAYTIAMGVQPHVAIWILYLTNFRNLTLAQVGTMEGFFWGVSMLSEVPTGAFADRYGRKLSFLAAAVVEGAGILAFGLASNFSLLLFSYVLWAVGMAFRTGNAQAFLYDSLASEGSTREFPRLLGRISAVRIGAAMAGGVAGAGIAGAATLQTPIFVAVGAYVVAAVIALGMAEPPRGRPGRGHGMFGTIVEAFRLLRTNAPVRYVILFQVALSVAMVADFVLTQPFLERHAVPVALFGVLAIPTRLAGAGGALVAHRVADGLGLRRAAGFALVAVVGAMTLLGTIDHLAAFAALIASQAALAVTQPVVSGYINDRTGSHLRATLMSVIPLGMGLSYACSLPLIGVAADEELRLAFAALAVAVAALAGVFFLLWLRADGAQLPGQGAEPVG